MKAPETSDVTSSQTGAIGASRLKASVVYTALIAALGGLLFGFDTAVISGATDWLKSHFALSNFWWGFSVASALIGTSIGAIVIGRPADVLGRRSILFILAIFYFVSAIGCAMAWDWWSFVAFRVLGGLAVGGASVASPMYIAEIAPARYRGRLVAFAQFNIVLGILLAYLSNYIILKLNLGESQYRWMFGVMAAPSAAFFLLLFLTPQSPRWLVARNRLAEARMVLEKCGTDSGVVEDEIREIQGSLDVEHHDLAEPFFCRKYLKPIMLAVAIAMFNQLSGINAILYYANHIFEMAGASAQLASLQSVIIGFTNLIVTVAAMAVIDHFGRRRLMIVGSIGYIVSLIAAAYAFYTNTGGKFLLISLLVFVASHAFGQGAVIWVFISEIFPNRVRARGQALGTFTHWVMATLISQTFPIIAAKSGGNIFTFYAVCMVGQLFWVVFTMPETKGISLERIQKHLGIE
ncbi:MAG TPA: sugar porter family MFS transporter [Alphaproteobacteria bacterium]|nr:sugar porter family MFS transporter [Alphaproteobacteria bacterium]